ncbi:MAG: SUMF1/EgtB/PvdO family nonheme iron enzyme [Pirellulaceae bacterium]
MTRPLQIFLPSLSWSLLVLIAACSRPGGDSENHGTPASEALQVLRPASGGEMIQIAGGPFSMGDAQGRSDESPHNVQIGTFYIDRVPVTQALYEEVTGTNPSKRKAPNLPAERVPWTEAARFCNLCSQQEELTPCYDTETWECDFEADGYRLPTEAEWEYACRAGSATRFSFGDDENDLAKYAWAKPHSRGRTWPVGQKRPNAWGLYDMHGNVWEWCNDFYSDSYYRESPLANPRGPGSGKRRVLRGGAWNSPAEKCRAAYRFKEFAVFTDACFGSDSYGFRRVRSVRTSGGADDSAEAPMDTATVGDAATHPSTLEATQTSPPTSDASVAGAMRRGGSIAPKRLTGSIAFVSDRGGDLDIWMMEPTGRNPRQLTQDEHPDADPRFSPDGKQILYTTLRDGFPQVWVMHRDGTGAKRIADGAQATWSPDGLAIALIRDDQTYVRDLETGGERRITPEAWQRCGVPAWSPDGSRIAVASRHLGEIGIFLLSPSGEDRSQVVTDQPCCTPHWSPSGKRLAFQTVQGHIHELDLENAMEEQVTFGADIQHEPCYSPDGTMLAFCRAPTADGPWQICILDLESDDLNFIQITHEGSNRLPDWTQYRFGIWNLAGQRHFESMLATVSSYEFFV